MTLKGWRVVKPQHNQSYKFTYWMTNSADSDQLAYSEANLSGSTQFAKAGLSRFSQTRIKIKYTITKLWRSIHIIFFLISPCKHILWVSLEVPHLVPRCSWRNKKIILLDWNAFLIWNYLYVHWFGKQAIKVLDRWSERQVFLSFLLIYLLSVV